ncbi:MAG: hypothetical protein QNJ06_13450 [Kiloniellales bacterium]|nr:hypothetical protein [Kiloniellales bacterium]MDJ0981242.1 hypothetical protein [Kiloniellales bacterium]
MPKVVEVVMGPSVTETGIIGRAVTLENGWGQVQSYNKKQKMWEVGGTNLQSLWGADDISQDLLEQYGFDAEDIQNILWKPRDE